MYRMKLDLSIWDILGAVDDTKKKEKTHTTLQIQFYSTHNTNTELACWKKTPQKMKMEKKQKYIRKKHKIYLNVYGRWWLEINENAFCVLRS